MSESLKPCPFCGEKRIYYGPHGVNCPACLAMVPEDKCNPDAPAAWNRRAPVQFTSDNLRPVADREADQ